MLTGLICGRIARRRAGIAVGLGFALTFGVAVLAVLLVKLADSSKSVPIRSVLIVFSWAVIATTTAYWFGRRYRAEGERKAAHRRERTVLEGADQIGPGRQDG